MNGAATNAPTQPGWGLGDTLIGLLGTIALAAVVSAIALSLVPPRGVIGLASQTAGRVVGEQSIDPALGSDFLFEIALLAIPLAYARRHRGSGSTLAVLGLVRTRIAPALGLVVGGYLGYLAIGLIVSLLLDPSQADATKNLGADAGTIATILVGVIIVAIVPICEEVLFRGFLFAGLRTQLGPWVAATLTAVLFGAAHLSGDNANPAAALQLAALGGMLCFTYHRSGSLWTSIGLHMLNNAISFAVLIV